jgi:hypothetical protein
MTAADTSGNVRDGTLEGGPTFTAGLYKNSDFALQNADNQSVMLPPNTDFIRNAPGATLLAWMRADDLSATRNLVVINNADAAAAIGNARALIEFDPANGLRALGRQNDTGGSSMAGGFTPVVGRTYFVAGVFDFVGNAIRLYVDGEQVAQNLSPNPGWGMNSADTANLVARIGSHANGTQQWWNGAIDGVRIYDEVLSPTTIFDTFLAEVLSPPGDTDGDGVVELEDLTPIRTHYRQTVATKAEGDLNGDTLVDFRDFREWKTWYLQTIGEGSLSGVNVSFLSAPEPAAVSLVCWGLASAGLGVRRRRSNRKKFA